MVKLKETKELSVRNMNNVATIQDQLIGNKEEVLIIVESNLISLFSLLLRQLLLLIILYCVVVDLFI